MGGRGQHFERTLAQPLDIRLVELFDRTAEPIDVAADFVQREQQVVAEERGVLETLGLDRPGVLLQLHRKE